MLLQAFSPECNVIIQNPILLPICSTETNSLNIGLICFMLSTVLLRILTFTPISASYATGFLLREILIFFLHYAEQPRSHLQLQQFVFSRGSETIFLRKLDNFNFLFTTKKFWCSTFLAQTNFVFRLLATISSKIFLLMPIIFLLTFKEWARDILSIFSSLLNSSSRQFSRSLIICSAVPSVLNIQTSMFCLLVPLCIPSITYCKY